MDRLQVLNQNGKKILCLDFSNINIKSKVEIIDNIEKAKSLIRQEPAKSLLILTNVTNTGFDTEVAAIFKEYASHNTPYVKASALVGVTGLQKVILSAVKKLTGREYNLFDSVQEAIEWLAAQ